MKPNKWLAAGLSLTMLLSNCAVPASAAENPVYKDGTYLGTATAVPDEDEDFDPYEIKVAVEIADGKISKVAYTEDNDFGDEDNETYANRAMDGTSKKVGVAEQIITNQGVEGVDAVSGATCTSEAIITAVSAALEQAEDAGQGDDSQGDDNQTEQVYYVLMNVPYADFYGELNNDVAVDIVSSATTSKSGNCSNVYSSGATVEGGLDLNGVVIPVKLDSKTYQEVKDLVPGETSDYYISQVLEEIPAVYAELTYADGKYEFSKIQGEVTSVSDVEAEILSSTTWGDYQVNLLNSDLGKDPTTVYGVYFTTEDGTQYAMRQSENLWNPHSYYEFSWSTGVKTSDIHGGILHSAHYASMEGKTITSITYITSEGIETYNLASGLYVAPHHEGKVSAVATSENTLKLYGVPADLENVTVSVATTGRGSVTLAANAAIGEDGVVKLDEGNTFEADKVYNVVVSSSNFAAMTTTIQYTDEVYVLMNIPYAEFYSELNNDVAVDIVSSATTSKSGNCSNVYSGGATIENGLDLDGVVVPVKMDLATYQKLSGQVSGSGEAYYISGAVSAPAVYMELTYADGKYEFSKIQGEVTGVSDVEAEILSSTTWGDYQVNLLDSNMGKDPATVYGVYFTTEDGTQYAMRQSENLWNPHNYYEFSWSTGVKTSEIHGGILHSAHYASMEGKTITSITYITSEGIETYNLASGLYVAPHHEGKVGAVATSENTLKLYGVPADLENVTVSVATTGRGSVTLAANAAIGEDGVVKLDEGNTFEADKVYNVVVSSSNFAAMTTTVQYTAMQFTDVKSSDYYYNSVLWAVQNGVTAGTSATTFSPNKTCTRAEIVTFLWAQAGKPEATGTNPFVDVKEDDYYYQAVLWAAQNGITAGTSATTFSPNKTCTRAEAVTFLWAKEGKTVVTGKNPFVDVKSSDYYYNSVLWAVQNGVTAGTSATTFSPNKTCTRAEAVTFLYGLVTNS